MPPTATTVDERFTEILTAIADVKGVMNALVNADRRNDDIHKDFEARLRVVESINSKSSGGITVLVAIISILISGFGGIIAEHYWSNNGTTVIQQPATHNKGNN